jgi:hypothetical protein
LSLNTDVSICNLVLDGGAVTGTSDLTITGRLTWAAGRMTGTGRTIIDFDGVLIVDGTTTKTLSQRMLSNYGAFESGTPSIFERTRDSDGQLETFYDRTSGADYLESRATNALAADINTMRVLRDNPNDANADTLNTQEAAANNVYESRVNDEMTTYVREVDRANAVYNAALLAAGTAFGSAYPAYLEDEPDFVVEASCRRNDIIAAAAETFTREELTAYNNYLYTVKKDTDIYNQSVKTAQTQYMTALRTAPAQGCLIGDISRWAVYMHDLLRGNVATPPPLPPDRANANFPPTPDGFLSTLSSNSRDALAIAYFRRWGIELADDINATQWIWNRGAVFNALFQPQGRSGWTADVSDMMSTTSSWLTDTINSIAGHVQDLPATVGSFASSAWDGIVQTTNESVQMLRRNPLEFIATAGEVWLNTATVQANTLTFGLIPGLNTVADGLVGGSNYYRAVQVVSILGREAALAFFTGGVGNIAGASVRGLSLAARFAPPMAGVIARRLMLRYAGRQVTSAIIRGSGAAVCRLTSAHRLAQPYFLYEQVAGIVSNVADAQAAIRRGDYESAALLIGRSAGSAPHAWVSACETLRLFNALSSMQAQTIRSFLAACFAAGTPILGEQGAKPIEEYQPGERVWAHDENDPSAPAELKEIEEVFVNEAPLWHVHIDGHVVRATAEHPFWVVGTGWTAARALAVGDRLLGFDGKETPVEEVFETGTWEAVYNLRVAQHHTYFVGCAEWGFDVWAHNVCRALRIARGQARALDAAGIPGGRRLLNELYSNKRKSGYIFQTQRAYRYYRRGELQAVETRVSPDNKRRLDIRLMSGQRVEVKSWVNFDASCTEQTARDRMLQHLREQVELYLRTPGSRLRIEFNEVTPPAARELIMRLKATYGDRLTWRTIR